MKTLTKLISKELDEGKKKKVKEGSASGAVAGYHMGGIPITRQRTVKPAHEWKEVIKGGKGKKRKKNWYEGIMKKGLRKLYEIGYRSEFEYRDVILNFTDQFGDERPVLFTNVAVSAEEKPTFDYPGAASTFSGYEKVYIKKNDMEEMGMPTDNYMPDSDGWCEVKEADILKIFKIDNRKLEDMLYAQWQEDYGKEYEREKSY